MGIVLPKEDTGSELLTPNKIGGIVLPKSKSSYSESKFGKEEFNPDYDYGALPNMNKEALRGEKQGWVAETANAIGGGLAKIPYTVIGNVASILDFEDYANTDNEIGNRITSAAEEIKGDIEAATKIYKSNNNTLGSREWWMNNGKGLIDSAGGFILTGAGLGKGVQLLSNLAKGSKVVKTIGAIANASMLNQAESIPIAMKVYNDAINMGVSEEDAADAAAYSININRINIPLNLTSAFAFLRPIATTRQVAKDFSRKEIINNIVKEGSQEYLEENVNMIAEKEAIKKAEQGNSYSYNFDNTVNDLLSKEGFETGLVGFIGGAVQTGGTDLIGHLQKDAPSYDIDGNVRADEFGEPIKISRITSQKERFKAQQKSLNNIELLSKGQGVHSIKETLDKVRVTSKILNDIQIASIANDEVKVEELKNELLAVQALDAFKNGTTEQLIDMYKSIQKDPLSKDKLGDDFIIKASEAIKEIETLEKVYQKYQHLPQINKVFNNRSSHEYNMKEAGRFMSAVVQAQAQQGREIEITGYNTEEKINSLQTTKELKGIKEKFKQVQENIIKLNDEFNEIITDKYTDKVVKDKKAEEEKKDKEDKSYEEHLKSKNELLNKIDASESHTEIQSIVEQLKENPLLEKDDIDRANKKFDSVKGLSIRREQISKQLELAKSKRDGVLAKLDIVKTDIDTRAKETNSIVSDYNAGKSELSQKKLFKLIDSTQSDIFKLQDHSDVLDKELRAAEEEITILNEKSLEIGSINSIKEQLESRIKDKEKLDIEITDTKENITALEKLLRKLKQIFKSLFPTSKVQLAKGRYEVVEAKEELLSRAFAIKQLKETVTALSKLREKIINDIKLLNEEINEYESEFKRIQLSFEEVKPVINEDFIEITNTNDEKEGEWDRAKKDITYALSSTGGNNMLYLGDGKWSNDILTNDKDQVRWFEFTSKITIGASSNYHLMAVTKNNIPEEFKKDIVFIDDEHIALILFDNDNKAIRTDGLVYTSLRLPITTEKANNLFTNKHKLEKSEIKVIIDAHDVLRDKIKSSKVPLYLKVNGKTKGIQVESNVRSVNGEAIFRFPIYGRLTKNNKINDLEVFVATSLSEARGTQIFDTTPGMVYVYYDGQLVPLKVAKLSEIDGAVDKSIELIKDIQEVIKTGKKLADGRTEGDIFKQLNLLFLYGNIKKKEGFLESKFTIFVHKDGRLNFNGKYHDYINELELRNFLENKFIRVSNKLLKKNKPVVNPITGERSSYKYYLMNDRNKASDQVLVGTSIINQDKQQFRSVGLKFDYMNIGKSLEDMPAPKITSIPKVSTTSKGTLNKTLSGSAVDDAINAALGGPPKGMEFEQENDLNSEVSSAFQKAEEDFEREQEEKKQFESNNVSKNDVDAFMKDVQNARDKLSDTGMDFDRAFLPEETPATQAELAKEEEWFKENFPQIDYERLKEIIGGKAGGRFLSKGKVLISDLAAKGTTYHEAWHVVSQLLLTEEQLKSLYKDYRKRTGFKGTDFEVEELIAEDFRNFMLGDKTSFSPKTKSIFQQIVDFFKNLFNLNNKDLDLVFSNIKNGKYKSSKIIRNNAKDFNRTLPGKSVEFTKDLIDSVNFYFFRNLLNTKEENGNQFSIDNVFELNGSEISSIYDKVYQNFLATYDNLPEDIKNGLLKNYVYVKNNWDTVINEHIKYLEKYGVKIKLKKKELVSYAIDESNESEDERSDYENNTQELEKTSKDNTYIDSIKFSAKDGMPKAIKLLIASLPQGRIIDGKFKINVNSTFGTPKIVDYGKTIDFLHNNLAGYQSLRDMISKISLNIENKPELYVLLKYLNSNITSPVPVTLSPSQFNLSMKFFQQFAKTKNTYLTTMVDPEGNIYSFDSNSSKLGDKIITLWKNNQKDDLNSGNGFYTITKDGIISVNKNRINSIAASKPLSNLNNSIFFLKKFGIEFSTDNFTDEEGTIIRQSASRILEYAVNKDISDIFQKDAVGGILNDLINIEANYNKDEVELQHINPEGETVYGITLNTYLSLIVNNANNSSTLNHLSDSNHYSKNSIWAESIRNGSRINLEVAEGLKSNMPGEEGIVSSDLDMGSYLLQSLNLILANRFPFLRAGDKKLEYVFGGLTIDLNKKEYIDQMLLYYEDDVMRSMDLKNNGIGSNVRFYNINASKSLIFEGISDIYPNFDKIKTKEQVKDFIKKNKSKLTKEIEAHLKGQVETFESSLLKYGMIGKMNSEGEYKIYGIDKTLLKELIGKEDLLTKDEIDRLGELFTIKSMVANIEQTKLFTGDLAFYNVVNGDFNKRTGGLTGPKKLANTDLETNEWLNTNIIRQDKKIADGKINTIIYNDVESTSEYIDEYIEIIGKDKALSAYKNMKEADGQGYITLDEYREMFLRHGDWTKQHEKAYKKLIKGEKINRDDFQYFMPIKPMHFGEQTNENGLYIPTYYKLSLMPLIPSMIKGRQLEILNENMKKNKIGIAMFVSANKVGATMQNGALVKFYNEKGEVNNNENIQEINYKNIGIQLDIAPVDKRKVIFGTQFRKLILSNLFSNGKAKIIKVLRGDKLVEVSGKEIKDNYDGIVNKLTEIKRDKLKEKLGIEKRSDGSFSIKDVNEFKKIILSEAESREVADNVIKSIELALDGDNNFLDATISKHKIEQILYSLVNNNIVSQKMFGDMKVMGSATGFELEARRFKTLTEDNKSNIQWVGNTQTLKFYHKTANGSTSKIQVLLPSWFKEIIGDDLSRIDSKLLELIGFRIPTQGLNSIDSIEVVGFLPKEAGNLIITPSEIVGKAGSDYDVDKLNIFFPNYIMVKGFPRYLPITLEGQKSLWNFMREADKKYIQTFDNFLIEYEEGILQNKLINISKEILSSPDMFNQLILPNSVGTLKRAVKELREAVYGKGVEKDKITGTKLLQWIDNAKTALSFWSGKAGVGIAALHNTSHILSQQSGLYISPEAKTFITLSHNITENGDIDLSSEFDATHEIDPKTKIVIKQGVRISDIINEFVNAYVDIANDPFIFDLNAGIQTSNTWLYMIRAGVPIKTAAEFMKQPIIWDYIVGQSINESVIKKTLAGTIDGEKSKVQLIAEIREKYGLKKFKADQVFKFDQKNLRKNLNENVVRDEKFNEEQQAILTEFLEMQRMGKLLGKMMQVTNQDTKGAGKNRNSARNTVEDLNIMLEKEVFGNMDKYINDSVLKEFIKTVKEAANYYNELFVTDVNKIRKELLDQIKKNVKGEETPPSTVEDLMDLAENELITYLIHTVPQNGKVLANEIDKLFLGDNSLAHRLIAAKKDPELKNNYFIESIFPLVANNRKNVDNIKQFSRKLSVYDSNRLTEAYLELYNANHALADDITKLGILQSGLSNSPISFLSVIPAEKFFEIASKSINLTVTSDNVNLSDFIDLFYQNNYNNNKLVRTLPKWKIGANVLLNDSGVLTFKSSEDSHVNDVYLKTFVKKDLTREKINEMKANGESIYDIKLYKKGPGELEFTEVPIKGQGMYLRDYRKTDNVIKRERVFTENKGKASVITKGMNVDDALFAAFGMPIIKSTVKTKAVENDSSDSEGNPDLNSLMGDKEDDGFQIPKTDEEKFNLGSYLVSLQLMNKGDLVKTVSNWLREIKKEKPSISKEFINKMIDAVLTHKFIKRDADGAIEYIRDIANKWFDEIKSTTPSQTGQIKPENFTNHSGGALGADSMFDTIGKEFGVTEHKHYYYGNKTPIGNVGLTKAQVEEGITHAKAASKSLNRPWNDAYSALLGRNWFQVKNSTQVIAIAPLINPGEKNDKGYVSKSTRTTVDGGTGYAVEMGIANNKNVFVFDTNSNKWFKWNGKTFVESEIPVLEKNFAGIGSRQDAGKMTKESIQAIRDVYSNTFKSTNKPSTTTPSQKEIKTDNKLQNEDKKTILNDKIIISEDDLMWINMNASFAGIDTKYTMFEFNNLDKKKQEKLIECYGGKGK